jgi:hypothetical protein
VNIHVAQQPVATCIDHLPHLITWKTKQIAAAAAVAGIHSAAVASVSVQQHVKMGFAGDWQLLTKQ